MYQFYHKVICFTLDYIETQKKANAKGNDDALITKASVQESPKEEDTQKQEAVVEVEKPVQEEMVVDKNIDSEDVPNPWPTNE